MNSSEFKQMIKRHIVKQTFCIPRENSLSRVYMSTDGSNKKYLVTWTCDTDNKCVNKDVIEISDEQYKELWNQYVDKCNWYIKWYASFSDILSGVLQELNNCEMWQKKYWTVHRDTLMFMINDRRI